MSRKSVDAKQYTLRNESGSRVDQLRGLGDFRGAESAKNSARLAHERRSSIQRRWSRSCWREQGDDVIGVTTKVWPTGYGIRGRRTSCCG